MSKQSYRGACHCGLIQFEAVIDLSSGTGKCNCTFCTKDRYWGVHVKPDEFKLLTGEDQLRSYSRKQGGKPFSLKQKLDPYENNLPFCSNCGVHAFCVGNIPEIGGLYVSINVACLDDVDFESVMQAPIHFMNGRDDDWFSPPPYSGHL